jgi:hypothetical protein
MTFNNSSYIFALRDLKHKGLVPVSHNNSRLLMWSLPLSFLVPLCLLSYVQKQVTILVHQKQFGTY